MQSILAPCTHSISLTISKQNCGSTFNSPVSTCINVKKRTKNSHQCINGRLLGNTFTVIRGCTDDMVSLLLQAIAVYIFIDRTVLPLKLTNLPNTNDQNCTKTVCRCSYVLS